MPTTRDAQGNLQLGGLSLSTLANDPDIGTPTYVYDLDAIADEARDLHGAFEGSPHAIAYAVKANSAGPIVQALAREGCGADVVSGAELLLALACGMPPSLIVFSGVAKQDWEIDRAIQAGPHGIGALQIESIEEIARVEARASVAKRRARVSIRVNPGVAEDALGTHKGIATGHDEAKFGVAMADVPRAVALAAASSHLTVVGLTCHVGSQLTSVEPYAAAARSLFALAARAIEESRVELEFVDPGGGFGIDYGAGCGVKPADFVRAIRIEQMRANLGHAEIHVEPGRSLVAAHGVLLARVLQVKRSGARQWMMIDAGMNDLLRPALYQAHHRMASLESPSPQTQTWRVVGPVCESSDDFGLHELPAQPPAALAILDAGAYGYTMASRYNGRALPAEVFVRGGKIVARSVRRGVDEWVRERVEIPRSPGASR